MIDYSLYVPIHKIDDFKCFLSNLEVDFDNISDDKLLVYASEFTYGVEKKSIEKKDENILIEKKTEEEIFYEVMEKKISDWNVVEKIVWCPSILKGTTEYVFSIEIHMKNNTVKRIVLRDKKKSIRFLLFLENKLAKVLNEKC